MHVEPRRAYVFDDDLSVPPPRATVQQTPPRGVERTASVLDAEKNRGRGRVFHEHAVGALPNEIPHTPRGNGQSYTLARRGQDSTSSRPSPQAAPPGAIVEAVWARSWAGRSP